MDIMTSNLFSAISKEGARNIGKSAAMGVAAATVIFLACAMSHFGTPAYLSRPWIISAGMSLIAGGIGFGIMMNGLQNDLNETNKKAAVGKSAVETSKTPVTVWKSQEKRAACEREPANITKEVISELPKPVKESDKQVNLAIRNAISAGIRTGRSVKDVLDDIVLCFTLVAPEVTRLDDESRERAQLELPYQCCLQDLAELLKRVRGKINQNYYTQLSDFFLKPR